MKIERNTNINSNERIWVNRNVGPCFYSTQKDSVKKAIEYLQDMECKAKQLNIEDIRLEIQSPEEDCDNCGIYVTGWRLETDVEYKRRLESNLFYMKTSRDNWEKKKAYYDSNGDVERIKGIEDVIAKLNNLVKD